MMKVSSHLQKNTHMFQVGPEYVKVHKKFKSVTSIEYLNNAFVHHVSPKIQHMMECTNSKNPLNPVAHLLHA